MQCASRKKKPNENSISAKETPKCARIQLEKVTGKAKIGWNLQHTSNRPIYKCVCVCVWLCVVYLKSFLWSNLLYGPIVIQPDFPLWIEYVAKYFCTYFYMHNMKWWWWWNESAFCKMRCLPVFVSSYTLFSHNRFKLNCESTYIIHSK